jgi:mRNA interferase MazF
MFEFGSIVLARFPFTDLSGHKLRPALIVSRDNDRRSDVIVAFITSRRQASNPDTLEIAPTAENGLKVASTVRFDKLVTLEKATFAGKIGHAESAFLKNAAPVFFGVFGFDPR